MARRQPATVHGLLAIDKPAGMTSHDVVARVRKALHERKVGHSGTLDPDATGVLMVGVGNATRLLRFVDVIPTPLGIDNPSFSTVDLPKQHVESSDLVTSKAYTAEVVLGAETSTLDASGEVVATFDMSAAIADIATPQGRQRLEAIISSNLVGHIMQTPPMVSAIRVDGRRLHELAREGIEVEREARPVTVHSFTVMRIDGPVIGIHVRCSSGTYVRTLGESVGRLLGGGAHIRNLRRVEVGLFGEDDLVSLDEVSAEHLLPVVECVRGLTQITVDADTERRALLGQVLPAAMFEAGGAPPWAVVSAESGGFIAVYEPFDGHRIAGRAADEKMARPIVVSTSVV